MCFIITHPHKFVVGKTSSFIVGNFKCTGTKLWTKNLISLFHEGLLTMSIICEFKCEDVFDNSQLFSVISMFPFLFIVRVLVCFSVLIVSLFNNIFLILNLFCGVLSPWDMVRVLVLVCVTLRRNVGGNRFWRFFRTV